MSFLCGCFGSSTSDSRHHNKNKVHIDPRGGGSSKAWDDKDLSQKQKNIVFLGLGGSGKTALIHQIIEKKILLPPPSISIEQYKIVLNDDPMVIIDVPGSAAMTVREGFVGDGLFALIFVIDWADELRRCLAIESLAQLYYSSEQVRSTPLLVVVNKVDPDVLQEPGPTTVTTTIAGGVASISGNGGEVPHKFRVRPVTPEVAATMLGLAMIPHPRMRVVCCSAAAGWGVSEILVWLNDARSSDAVKSDTPVQGQSILW